MKLFLSLSLIHIALAVHLAKSEPQYPVFTGEVTALNAIPNFEQRLFSAYPLLQQIARPGDTTIVPPHQIEAQLQKAASKVSMRTWPVVAADGKMPLPQVLISDEGVNGGLDNMFRIEALSAQQDQEHLMAYACFWGALLDQHPKRAFEIMAEKAKSLAVTSLDVLTVTASIANFPGGRGLSASPSKADWAAILNSANPCYRFLALEYFDAVPQTPEELLSLYRQCLFGACSYMEARALTAINRHEDYREAVAKLLEEYAASNPMMDDGTISKIRDLYRDRVKASIEIVQRIRKHIAKHGEKKPSAITPDNQATPKSSRLYVPSNRNQDVRPTAPPTKSNDGPTSSTSTLSDGQITSPWRIVALVLALLIVAVILVLRWKRQ